MKKNSRIFLSPPHLGDKEHHYLMDALQSNWIAPCGPHIDLFETELSNYLGGVHVAALNSGTSAIHLALVLAGVTTGDEVLCPTFTFCATVNPILYQGAIPVFVDSEPESWNMDPELLKSAISERKKLGRKPKACIVVHTYGMPAQIKSIRQICDEEEIILVEDAAEALGSGWNDLPAGTFGHFAAFSFNGNKIITTSAGGALVSNDPVPIKKARHLASQARDPAPHYEHSEIGYNYRMSNLCAALGRAQLEVLEERVRQRRTNFDFYSTTICLEWQKELPGLYSNRWLCCALFPAGSQRDLTREALNRSNIETRPLWKPMHLQPVFSHFPKYLTGVSDRLFTHGLCFPSGSCLTTDELHRIRKVTLATGIPRRRLRRYVISQPTAPARDYENQTNLR